jgi:hypothetical protein
MGKLLTVAALLPLEWTKDVLLRVRVLIQGSLRKRRLFFVFKAGG